MSVVPWPNSRTVMQSLTQKALYLRTASNEAGGIFLLCRDDDM